MAQQTAMQELYQHFLDAWSSPGDCWNPGKVIDKVESMIKKEKEQIIQAFDIACEDEDRIGEEYYNEAYDRATDTE